jgi:predicted GTPase
VCAVRTGAGKSQVSRHIARILREMGYRVATVRHPMPYGDLARQAVQRFTCLADLDSNNCTIEEREEYEPPIKEVGLVFAGVDYERILRVAERETDIILWDGATTTCHSLRPISTSSWQIPIVPAMSKPITPVRPTRALQTCSCSTR